MSKRISSMLHIVLLCSPLLGLSTAHSDTDWGATCQEHKQNVAQCHDKSKTVSERLACYQDIKSKLKEACFKNNGHKEEVDKKVEEIMTTIDALYRQKYDVDNAALVHEDNQLRTIQRLIDALEPKVTQHAREISAFAKNIRDNYIHSFEPFKQQLLSYVNEASNEQSSVELTGTMSDIHHWVLAELQQCQQYISQLSMLRFVSEQMSKNTFDVFSPYLTFMEANGIHMPLSYDINTLDNIAQYLEGRYQAVLKEDKKIRASLDKKHNALMHYEAQVALTENVQTAMLLRRKTQYLQEVQVVVDAFKNPPTSTFNRIIYYAPYWQHAQSLQDIMTYCDSSEVSHWQSLGCHRAQAYRQNVARAINSNIPYGILFGLQALASLGDSTPQPDLQDHIRQLIQQKRTPEAAQLFDTLLKEAEEIAP